MTDFPLSWILCAFVGYLLGSLPFAVVVSRCFQLPDPRHYGSGNPGATNVLRSGHKVAAALTLLGDAFKGWLPMFLAGQAGFGFHSIALAGAGAFIGHLFPLFMGFKGGKGVATALGVLAGFSASLSVLCALVWLAVAAVFRYSSAAALCAALSAPALAWVLVGPLACAYVGALSAVLIARHRANILRLIAGTEGKIGR
jgi:glycerol-3-phosphate acyltransferase PlsY